jgi:lysophospholipase L1-like esterase
MTGALLAIVMAVPLLNTRPSANQPNWANPSTTTLKRMAAKIDASGGGQPSYLSNLNCTQLTFRYQSETTMQNGCFTATAFGFMDVDSHAVIFTGTDEAIRVSPAGNSSTVPLYLSAVVGNLTPAPLAGSYLNFYRYFPNVLSDVWDYAHLSVAYKQVTGNADMHFTDGSGQQLAVNPESIAFSNNGAWMVVESPWHSFMRVNLATFEKLPFAPSYNYWPYDTQMHTSQVSISDDGRYVAIQSDDISGLKVYDLSNCSGDIGSDLKPISCASHDYQQTVHDTVPGYSHTTKVRFLNDSILSIDAAYTEGTGATATSSIDTYLLSPSGEIGSLINYLALGDSYTSGEGSFNYKTGTDLSYNRCHLSAHSYPLLLSQDVFHGDGHSVACSGARIHDLDDTSGGYPGQVSGGIARKTRTDDSVNAIINEYSPGYIAQYEFARTYQPKVLTVSVGGNDMGFANIIKTCANISLKASTCYDSYEDRQEVIDTINSQLKPLVTLYTMLQKGSPQSSIYAIGYPVIMSGGGSCALNVHMDAHEIEFTQEITEYINGVIKQAADAAGVQYADISQALYGHRLCEARSYDVAVNGLTAGTDDGPGNAKLFGSESYHPNALGQELIEQAILAKTKNFTLPAKQPDKSKTIATKPPANAPILAKPKTGKATHTVVQGKDIAPAKVTRGKKTTVKILGTTSGFKPNTAVTISVGGVVVGSSTTDGDGNVDQEITIPPDQPPGYQPVTVTGEGPDGQPVDVTQPIYVGSSDTDTDGDDIPDSSDSCPGAINSGVDQDADDIDDACDGTIGPDTSGGSPDTSTTDSGGTNTPTPPSGGGTGGTVTTPAMPTQSDTNPPAEDQGSTTIPVDDSNAVSDLLTGDDLDDGTVIAYFGDAANLSNNPSAIGIIPTASKAVATFPKAVKQDAAVRLTGPFGQYNVPHTPLANIGSIIRSPLGFRALREWWWGLIIFGMLCLFVGLFRLRWNRGFRYQGQQRETL